MSEEQDEPELATNETWRGIMVRARKDHGLSQQTLADKLGVSQPLISKIESGEVGSTKLVMPICRALGISLPEHFVDENDRAWAQVGRVLRYRNMSQFRRMLELGESMVKDYEEQAKRETEDVQPEEPKTRKP